MRAYEARRRRTLATDPSLKADLELIAQEWLALAEEVEWLEAITAHSSHRKPPLSNRKPSSNSNSRVSRRTRTRKTKAATRPDEGGNLAAGLAATPLQGTVMADQRSGLAARFQGNQDVNIQKLT
jgi:hypothetical protein